MNYGVESVGVRLGVLKVVEGIVVVGSGVVVVAAICLSLGSVRVDVRASGLLLIVLSTGVHLPVRILGMRREGTIKPLSCQADVFAGVGVPPGRLTGTPLSRHAFIFQLFWLYAEGYWPIHSWL